MNYRVIAESGLKIRSGAGVSFEEAADRLLYGDVVIGANMPSPDQAWLPIVIEDEEGAESTGWVAKQFVEEDQVDYRAQEVAKIIQSAPALAEPIFQAQLTKLYGRPREGAAYLKIIDLQEFASFLGHVRDYEGNRWSCRIYGHKDLEAPLRRAFGLICGQGLARELKTFDGCFCIRPMKASNSYSVHSWAEAVDFNATTNPFTNPKSPSWPELITDFSDEFVACFAAAGFEWGGLWRSCHDAMHFQLPWTQDWRQSDNPLRPQL